MTSKPQARHADPTATRRRGPALEDAIRSAAFEELCEVGYHAFSVESVAARAHTGKASIYRRWPTKARLVLDALLVVLPSPESIGLVPAPDSDVTTADVLRRAAREVAAAVDSPAGQAIRTVKFEALADPELAALVDESFTTPRVEALAAVIRRGVRRGEVRPDVPVQLAAEVLPALIVHRVVVQQQAMPPVDVEALVEEILLPMLAPHP